MSAEKRGDSTRYENFFQVLQAKLFDMLLNRASTIAIPPARTIYAKGAFGSYLLYVENAVFHFASHLTSDMTGTQME